MMIKSILSKTFCSFCLLMIFSGSVFAELVLDSELKTAINDGDVKQVKSLLPDAKEGEGSNIPTLELAIETNTDMFNMLMEDGINVYLDEDPEEIEAWLTSVDNNLSIFDLLVKNIPEKMVRNKNYHFTIFKQAISEGHIEAIKKIFDYKFDVNLQNGNGVTPLILAAKEGNAEIVELLLQNGSDVNHKSIFETALMQAVSQGYKSVVKILLENKADVNAQVHGGETAMWHLIRKKDPMMFDLLLEYGADINIKTRFGNTLLMEAVRGDDIDMVRLLISNGADVNAVDELGESPLMKAAEASRLPSVRLLIEMGADVQHKNKLGETALMKAVGKWRNHEILKLLLEKGIDTQTVSKLGQTAIMLAEDMGNLDYVEIIQTSAKK
jgi:ankyrin repeat protein